MNNTTFMKKGQYSITFSTSFNKKRATLAQNKKACIHDKSSIQAYVISFLIRETPLLVHHLNSSREQISHA